MKTLKLKHPVELDGRTYEELSIRRPKVKDRLAVDKMKATDAEKEVRLFSNLAEVPPELIETLDMSDYVTLQAIWQDFLDGTGGS